MCVRAGCFTAQNGGFRPGQVKEERVPADADAAAAAAQAEADRRIQGEAATTAAAAVAATAVLTSMPAAAGAISKGSGSEVSEVENWESTPGHEARPGFGRIVALYDRAST